jgi:hypothetical protein
MVSYSEHQAARMHESTITPRLSRGLNDGAVVADEAVECLAPRLPSNASDRWRSRFFTRRLGVFLGEVFIRAGNIHSFPRQA